MKKQDSTFFKNKNWQSPAFYDHKKLYTYIYYYQSVILFIHNIG